MTGAKAFDCLTVIIPTFNREKVLAKVLEGYAVQSSPELIQELLIVDDGSTDGTAALVRDFSRRAPFPVRYLAQTNKGPAAARNFGIREARSALVLFTDSDIIPERRLVAQHLEWHNMTPQMTAAVLGYVTWSPEVKPTPFMRWYGEQGMLFAFRRLRAGEKVSFHHFYTCNLSLKRDFLRDNGYFDEEFKGAAFEDIDLGYRLSQRGLQIVYNPNAIGYHHQFFSFTEACQKHWKNGPAARIFFQKESGKRVAWEESNGKRRFPAIALMAGKVTGLLLAPVLPLLNSRWRLPGFVYEAFFRGEANRYLRRKDTLG